MTTKLRHPPLRYTTLGDTISLKEFIDSRFDAMDRAVTAAKDALDVRLESMNEFRKQISEQTLTFIPRAEYLVQHQAVIDRIDSLQKICDDRFTQMNKRIQDIEMIKADIQGRIWATAVVVTMGVAIIQVLLHVFWGK